MTTLTVMSFSLFAPATVALAIRDTSILASDFEIDVNTVLESAKEIDDRAANDRANNCFFMGGFISAMAHSVKNVFKKILRS